MKIDDPVFTHTPASEKALREGEVALSSAMLNALMEAQATLDRGYAAPSLRERYVRELLERRRRGEASRAFKRKQRQTKWKAIQEGREQAPWITAPGISNLLGDPLAELPAATSLPSPSPSPSPAPAPAPAPASHSGDPLDALMGAVDDVRMGRAGRPTAPPVIEEGGVEWLSLTEAAERLGIRPGTFKQRVKRGGFHSRKFDVRRVRAADVAAFKFGRQTTTPEEAKAA